MILALRLSIPTHVVKSVRRDQRSWLANGAICGIDFQSLMHSQLFCATLFVGISHPNFWERILTSTSVTTDTTNISKSELIQPISRPGASVLGASYGQNIRINALELINKNYLCVLTAPSLMCCDRNPNSTTPEPLAKSPDRPEVSHSLVPPLGMQFVRLVQRKERKRETIWRSL
jgi:hypothetical protein